MVVCVNKIGKTEHIIKLQYSQGMVFEDHYERMYRDEKYKVQLEVITGRDEHGFPTDKIERSYFIDNDEKKYKSEEEVIEALNKKGLKSIRFR